MVEKQSAVQMAGLYSWNLFTPWGVVGVLIFLTAAAAEANRSPFDLPEAESEIIAVRTGPVFGNTVREGTGLLDVNNFPGLQEFNALSAELNALIEKSVLPALRDHAEALVVAPGTSCRHQVKALANRRALHPLEVLAESLGEGR